MHFGFALDLSDIDLLDTHLDLLDTDILSKHFACLQDVFKTSPRRCLQDFSKTSSRRFEDQQMFAEIVASQICLWRCEEI